MFSHVIIMFSHPIISHVHELSSSSHHHATALYCTQPQSLQKLGNTPPPRFVNFNMFINSRGAHLHSTVSVFLLAKITGSRTSTHGRRSRGKLVVTHGHQLTYKCDCVDTNSRAAYIFTSPEGRAFVVDMFMPSLRASHVIMFSHLNFTARESYLSSCSHMSTSTRAVRIFTRQSACSCSQR
jgi:hypothetical protein